MLVVLLHNVLGLDGINTNGQHISSIQSCVPVWCFYFSFLRSHHHDQQPCSSGLHLHLHLHSLQLFTIGVPALDSDLCAVCLG